MPKVRSPLTLAEFEVAIGELQSQSDRGVAIIGACLLDEILRELMIAAMQGKSSRNLHDTLFDGPTKPLGSFSAKIKLGCGLGLIKRADARALEDIRKIRNSFAHALAPKQFEDPEVASICSHLTTYLDDVDKLDVVLGMIDEDDSAERKVFLKSVAHLSLALLNNGVEVASAINDAVQKARRDG